MNLAELLKDIPKEPFSQRDAQNLGFFLNANAKKVDFYKVNDTNGDTYVILKWPHIVPELRII